MTIPLHDRYVLSFYRDLVFFRFANTSLISPPEDLAIKYPQGNEGYGCDFYPLKKMRRTGFFGAMILYNGSSVPFSQCF